MDKMGLVALIVGLVLCIAGGYAIWAFLPEVITAVKGLIGIVVLLASYACGIWPVNHQRLKTGEKMNTGRESLFPVLVSLPGFHPAHSSVPSFNTNHTGWLVVQYD